MQLEVGTSIPGMNAVFIDQWNIVKLENNVM
jgi:hypothetical protein